MLEDYYVLRKLETPKIWYLIHKDNVNQFESYNSRLEEYYDYDERNERYLNNYDEYQNLRKKFDEIFQGCLIGRQEDLYKAKFLGMY